MKKAAVAVAHRLLKIAYSLIRHGGEYRERGGDHFDRRNPEKTARKLVSRLERIGLLVTVTRPLPKPTYSRPQQVQNRNTEFVFADNSVFREESFRRKVVNDLR